MLLPCTVPEPLYADTLKVEFDHVYFEYYHQGDSDVIDFKQAIPLKGRELKIRKELFSTELFRAVRLRKNGAFNMALETFDSLEKSFKSRNMVFESGFCGIQKAQILFQKHPAQRYEALNKLNLLTQELEKMHLRSVLDSVMLRDLYFFLARGFSDLEITSKCHYFLNSCARVSDNKAVDGTRLIEYYHLRAKTSYEFKNYDVALGFLCKSDAVLLDTGFVSGHIEILNNIYRGWIYMEKGMKEAAHFYLKKVQNSAKRSSDKEILIRVIHLNYQYLSEFEPDNQADLTQLLLGFNEHIQLLHGEKLASLSPLSSKLYVRCFQLKVLDFKAARSKIGRNLRVANTYFGERSAISSYVLNNLGYLHAIHGNNDSAVAWLHLAIAYNHANYSDSIAMRPPELRGFADKVLNLPLMTAILRNKCDLIWEKSKEFNDIGKYMTCLESFLGHASILLSVADHMLAMSNTPNSRQVSSNYLEKTHDQMLESCWYLTLNAKSKADLDGFSGYAFRTLQRLKARDYLYHFDDLRHARVRKNISSQEYNRDKMNIEITLSQIANADGKWDENKISNLELFHSRLADQVGALYMKVGLQQINSKIEARYEQLAFSTEVTNELNDSVTLIDMYLGNGKLFLFAFNQRDYKFLAFPFGQMEKIKVDELLKLLHERPSDNLHKRELAKLLSWFYATYFAELDTYYLKNNLIICPSGILNAFPFETLLVSDPRPDVGYSKWNYWVKKRNITYAQSASQWTRDRQVKQEYLRTDWKTDYLFLSTLVDENQDQWASLISNYGKRRMVVGRRFNPRFLSKTELNARILHIQTHAHANEEFPLYSSFELYHLYSETDSLVDYGKVFLSGLKVKTELAILQACETGKGKIASGEGVNSIAKAFRLLGCPRVVSSLWKIPHECSNEILESTNLEISSGQNAGLAISMAKRTYLKDVGYPYEAHPYYWAGLVFHGADTPIFEPNQRKRNYLIPLFVLLFLATGFITFKRRGGKALVA